MSKAPTIGEWMGMNPTVPHNFNKAVPLACPDATLLYGLELEVEHTRGPDWVVGGMSGKEDGSLRNSGYEYITKPMSFSNLGFCLDNFFKKTGVTEANYSERCSVHVHTNCRDLTWDQVSTVCLLYQMLEKLLFRFIGHGRDTNIFCVPWSETTLSFNVINNIQANPALLKRWQKYTALNLLPLFNTNQGTIEWRHMQGTHDRDRILNWCRIIGCIFAHARKMSLEDTKKFVINLNSTSEYRGVIDALFGEWAHLLYVPEYELLLEEGVLNMKYALIGEDKTVAAAAAQRWQELDFLDEIAPAAAPQAELPELQRRIDVLLRNQQAGQAIAAAPQARPRAAPRAGARFIAPPVADLVGANRQVGERINWDAARQNLWIDVPDNQG